MKLSISFVPYNNGTWDFIIGYDDGDKLKGQIALSDDVILSNEDQKILQEIAPMCVWTKYARVGE